MSGQEAQRLYDQAESDLKDAQEDYNHALRTEGAQNVLDARARVDIIRDQIRTLKTGELSPQVKAAKSIFDQAQAADKQPQAAVQGAQASLALMECPDRQGDCHRTV